MEAPQNADYLPDQDIVVERLAVMETLRNKKNTKETVILLANSLIDQVPSPCSLESSQFTIAKGDKVKIEDLTSKLDQAGYQKETLVTARGQYSLRGGIVDIFSLQGFAPLRIEFFDDFIDSIREFDIDSQISISRPNSALIKMGIAEKETCLLRDCITPGTW